MQIWKYQLDTGLQGIEMPIGAQILSVQAQRGIICLWAMVDVKRELQRRGFLVIGTGVELPNVSEATYYHGTAQVGSEVWHVYGDQPRHRG